MPTIDAPNLPIVAGNEFLQRRERLNLTQEQVAAEAGMNRDTVSAIENGGGSLSKRRDLDKALTDLEAEGGLYAPEVSEPEGASPLASAEPTPSEDAPTPGLIRFKVEGVYGAKALVVEGPVENLAELEEMVDRVMRRLAGESGSTAE